MSTSTSDNLVAAQSTLVEAGQAFYESRLKATLEPDHFGEFVAVEPSAARYFLGQTATAALVAARNAMPESKFLLIRIGSSVAHKVCVGHIRIEELDLDVDAGIERVWIEEAQRRYDAYLKGEVKALPGDAVMQRARNRLRSHALSGAKCI